MQYRVDGDQLMLCANNFTNLQESPAVFVPLDGELARAILAEPSRVVVVPTPAQRLKFKAIDTLHWLIVRRGRKRG